MAGQKKNEVAVAQMMPTRLPYHPGLADLDVDKKMWRLLVESIYPSAETIEGIALAVRYCRERNLDVFKRPVHVVPVYNSKLKKYVEMVWPGIAEYRTTASRTQEYAGCDSTEFGPFVEETFSGLKDVWSNGKKTGHEEISCVLRYPEWARITVYRMIKGHRCAFVGPKVFFKEIYSCLSHNLPVPNARWQRSPSGMLEKTAEAGALRKAFPEELGNTMTAEEMDGKTIIEDAPIILHEPSAEKIQEIADEHLVNEGVSVGEKSEVDDTLLDWQSIYEELELGIMNCKSKKEIDEFMDENCGMIENMGTHASPEIISKWISMVKKQKDKL